MIGIRTSPSDEVLPASGLPDGCGAGEDGAALGVALALLAGLLEFASWYGVIVVAVVYGIGQVAESLVLTPRLVGERIGLNPLAVIFALLAFGHLFGFVGVLVALPVSALVLVGLRRVRQAYVASKLYLG